MRSSFAAFGAWLVALVSASGVAFAEAQPAVSPVPKQCEAPGELKSEQPVLRNVVKAMREKKRIVILAIGGTSASARGPVAGGNFAIVERLLERTFKSLDVQIVHRGVSGELATDAGQRIRNEVALTGADLVLWQVGTADAMSRVDVNTTREAVDETLRWLKERNIDVILVGMRYAKGLAKDAWYQQTRAAISAVAAKNGVLRISRYSAEESLNKAANEESSGPSIIEESEHTYNCTAEYLARAIAAGLFLRTPSPSEKPAPTK